MPYLYWNLDLVARWSLPARALLSLSTILGGVLLGRLFVQRYAAGESWRSLPRQQRLLDLVTLFLFVAQLLFYQIGDEYLIVFLPFTLIVIGQHLARRPRRHWAAAAVASAAMVIVGALWTRGLLEANEAEWRGAEMVRLAGVAPDQVYGPWTWNAYYGFDDYLAEAGGRADFHDFFDRWLKEKRKRAVYFVSHARQVPPGETWQIVAELPMQDFTLREQRVYVIRRG